MIGSPCRPDNCSCFLKIEMQNLFLLKVTTFFKCYLPEKAHDRIGYNQSQYKLQLILKLRAAQASISISSCFFTPRPQFSLFSFLISSIIYFHVYSTKLIAIFTLLKVETLISSDTFVRSLIHTLTSFILLHISLFFFSGKKQGNKIKRCNPIQ